MSTFQMTMMAVAVVLSAAAGAGFLFMIRPCGGQRVEPDVVIEGDRRPGDGF